MKPMQPAALRVPPSREKMPGRKRAFTLIELLVVIAIIGILTAILIPTVGSARVSARKAKTKVLFSQWAVAMEQFKQEYGYYPKIDGDGGNKIVTARFVAALTGRKIDGTEATATDLCGNNKRIAFYTLSEGEIDATRTNLVDPFGNMEIAVIYDKNGDRRLTSSDGSAVTVAGVAGSFAPATEDLDLTQGLQSGVIFYSAGKGNSAADLILSWK